MSSTSNAILLADIGGTNARFAWQSEAGAPIENLHSYPAQISPAFNWGSKPLCWT